MNRFNLYHFQNCTHFNFIITPCCCIRMCRLAVLPLMTRKNHWTDSQQRVGCSGMLRFSARLQTPSRRSCAKAHQSPHAPLNLLTPGFDVITCSLRLPRQPVSRTPLSHPYAGRVHNGTSSILQHNGRRTVSAQWFSIAKQTSTLYFRVIRVCFLVAVFSSSSWSLKPSPIGMFWTGLDCHRTGIVGHLARNGRSFGERCWCGEPEGWGDAYWSLKVNEVDAFVAKKINDRSRLSLGARTIRPESGRISPVFTRCERASAYPSMFFSCITRGPASYRLSCLQW